VLRTNLSTRPFYNERGVHLLLAVAVALVVLLTAFNAIRVITLSRQNTELSSLINNDRNEAQRLTREAQKIRAGINQDELAATAAAADEANVLIDQRTFSWTEFFNRIEETLPQDVMLTAVQPSFSNDSTIIQMTVLARRSEDIDEFMEKLEGTGAFIDVLPSQEVPTDEGLHRVQLRSVYTGEATAEEAKPEPTATDKGAAPATPDKPAATPAAPEKPPAASPSQPAGEGGRDSKPGRGGRGQ
jgi:Tfp pilus assembly protein PilN